MYYYLTLSDSYENMSGLEAAMSDGPYRNLKLDSKSKRFAEAVQNDAVDEPTRCALASDAIVNSILRENSDLIKSLLNHGSDGQLDFDPQASIHAVCDAHAKSQFGDHLLREISMRLKDGEQPQAAIGNSLAAALETHFGEFQTRIQEVCIDAFNKGEMYRDQLEAYVSGSNHTLKNLDQDRILNAIRNGNKSEFKDDTKMKTNVDDGPET
ncbi:hypothetical protein HBA51_09420 [Sphingopyxis terrae subsp. terrae]|nr:hypothetical protein HBA51_09420 [Sphingopyxis terrae subsp. terrae]